MISIHKSSTILISFFALVFGILSFHVHPVSAGTNAEGVAFLAKKATEEGVVKLPSGLLYKEILPGKKDISPSINTPCSCHYSVSEALRIIYICIYLRYRYRSRCVCRLTH